MSRRLVVRLDNVGDVLLAGPAVRAVAASGAPVDVLTSTAGAAAAELLPAVHDVLEFDAPWIGLDAAPVDAGALDRLVAVVAARSYSQALVLTSYHQSPLPTALLLRSAGVPSIAAVSVDHPGSLLDVREPYRPELHEVEQNLALAVAAGHGLPPHDDGRLQLRIDLSGDVAGPVPSRTPYVVVHPGASVPARALPTAAAAASVDALVAEGLHVVVTGTAAEAELVARVGGDDDGRRTLLAGALDLASLARLIAHARAVVVGNTGPAHLAAAVGTPVVQAFAPVVPARRWRPWMVPAVQLGEDHLSCRGCRARICPRPGQPCLEPFTASAVRDAVLELARVEAAA